MASAIDCTAEELDALAPSFAAAGVAVDFVVLAPADELGDEAASALQRFVRQLTHARKATATSSSAAAANSAPPRLVFFSPPDAELAAWQQLEPLLEALDLPAEEPCSPGAAASMPCCPLLLDSVEFGRSLNVRHATAITSVCGLPSSWRRANHSIACQLVCALCNGSHRDQPGTEPRRRVHGR